MKTKMKMEKRSHKYDINRPTPRHEHKYSKYKKYRSILTLIKHRLGNIWSSAHFIKKLSGTEVLLKKRWLYKKACVIGLLQKFQ